MCLFGRYFLYIIFVGNKEKISTLVKLEYSEFKIKNQNPIHGHYVIIKCHLDIYAILVS